MDIDSTETQLTWRDSCDMNLLHEEEAPWEESTAPPHSVSVQKTLSYTASWGPSSSRQQSIDQNDDCGRRSTENLAVRPPLQGREFRASTRRFAAAKQISTSNKFDFFAVRPSSIPIDEENVTGDVLQNRTAKSNTNSSDVVAPLQSPDSTRRKRSSGAGESLPYSGSDPCTRLRSAVRAIRGPGMSSRAASSIVKEAMNAGTPFLVRASDMSCDRYVNGDGIEDGNSSDSNFWRYPNRASGMATNNSKQSEGRNQNILEVAQPIVVNPSPPIPIQYARNHHDQAKEDIAAAAILEKKTHELKSLIDDAFGIVSPGCEGVMSMAKTALVNLKSVLRRGSSRCLSGGSELAVLQGVSSSPSPAVLVATSDACMSGSGDYCVGVGLLDSCEPSPVRRGVGLLDRDRELAMSPQQCFQSVGGGGSNVGLRVNNSAISAASVADGDQDVTVEGVTSTSSKDSIVQLTAGTSISVGGVAAPSVDRGDEDCIFPIEI